MIGVSVLSASFGDPVWIKQLVKRLLSQQAAESISEIVVVDQDRSSYLSDLFQSREFGKVRVVDFPRDLEAEALMGHDHGPSLNAAMKLQFSGSHLLILDSDMVPTDGQFLSAMESELREWDCVMAQNGRKGLSHPCLMAFPVFLAPSLDFTEGMREVQLDTGRLVALQAKRAGLSVRLLEPEPAFGGLAGHSFLSGRIFHFEQGSFPSSENPRICRKNTKTKTIVMEAVLENPPRLRFTYPQLVIKIAPRVALSKMSALKRVFQLRRVRKKRS